MALLPMGPGLIAYHMDLLLTHWWSRMEHWFICRLATVLWIVCGWIIASSVLMILADRLSRKAAKKVLFVLIYELKSIGGRRSSDAS